MTDTPWYRGLRVQLAALLTIALLPLGSIALFQTTRVAQEVDRNFAEALLGLTERAAEDEIALINRARGVATFVAHIAGDLLQDPERCLPFLSDFVAQSEKISFVGLLPQSGILECSSVDQVIDFSGYRNFDATMASQTASIEVNRAAPGSGESVFIISEPYQIDGVFAGFVSVSVPHRGLQDMQDDLARLGLIDLITFNSVGDILTSQIGLEVAEGERPTQQTLIDLYQGGSLTFTDINLNGIERRYSVVTDLSSPIALMAIWRLDKGPGTAVSRFITPAVFPVLMWIASMTVAMMAIHTLVLRHLSRVRRSMTRFADERRTYQPETRSALIPTEIEQLEQNFQRMSEEIIQDEARLEDALHDKNVLIKEIHHRVKNNLQLIASIMNMQIRQAENHETKAVLRRVQDRVMSLATIHRDLYQSQNSGKVDVGALVSEIVEKSVELASADDHSIKVSMNIEPIRLYPDQAVPLSLLVAEAATNAMKYVGVPEGDAPALDVSLKEVDEVCTLTMSNVRTAEASAESTGMGGQLISAFAMQLGGTIDTTQTDTHYTLTLTFKVAAFQPETMDY